ncbi:hypothetical protein AAG570_009981 [Ranatra chinensis]|uniref:Uncharacterized protein n=1 Tax=Ranatra chinensis TaxID=642074 RepID=A0ABD0ZBW0_9HEMI
MELTSSKIDPTLAVTRSTGICSPERAMFKRRGRIDTGSRGRGEESGRHYGGGILDAGEAVTTPGAVTQQTTRGDENRLPTSQEEMGCLRLRGLFEQYPSCFRWQRRKAEIEATNHDMIPFEYLEPDPAIDSESNCDVQPVRTKRFSHTSYLPYRYDIPCNPTPGCGIIQFQPPQQGATLTPLVPGEVENELGKSPWSRINMQSTKESSGKK